MINILQIIILLILSLLMMSASCDKGSEGCTNTDACNYDSVAIVEDGSCQYPEENYDCKGNCLAEMDCMGVCGGTAETDCCELCDSDNSNDPDFETVSEPSSETDSKNFNFFDSIPSLPWNPENLRRNPSQGCQNTSQDTLNHRKTPF